MHFIFVPIVILAASFSIVAAQSANIDPTPAPYKIDMMQRPTPVYVLNFPEVQTVQGTVAVSNLPAVQTVGGSVAVTNLPAVQAVGGTVNVANLPLDADGALRVGSSTGRFIGVTTVTVLGGAGWRDLNLACNSEFGATYSMPRMCTSKDILNTPVSQWPTLNWDAWVQPVVVSAAPFNWGNQPSGGSVDISGVVTPFPQDLSCDGWTGIAMYGADNHGLVLKSNGGFGTRNCTFLNTHVTCCANATP